ncbi:Ig-like domain-containing protein [Vannielia sp.]|uniref:Ig-like domain-containing protein n=1 Tax=Vannielia sp. TaxID=2813045 RepID=UPI00261F414E|nr:Ig-like domain-containing protein [Vannielia sp.]MDF1872423.1 Ig-like domain-containing protein [Vannielia sp.]
MRSVEFVIRDGAGNVSRGEFGADGVGSRLNVGDGQQVSLHIGRSEIQSYVRDGDDLVVTLADGSSLRLAGYFDGDNALYISERGELNAVDLTQGADDELYALYEHEASWGKWSPADDLIYYDEPEVMAARFDAGGLLGGFGGGILPIVAGGAAVVGGAGGGGGGDDAPVYDVTVNPGEYVLGGDDMPEPSFEVTGTGVPGESVTVTVGDVVQETVVGEDGAWFVVCEGPTLPADGDYVAEVVTATQDGEGVTLTGPSVYIDTVAPEVTFTAGTQSVGDMFNGETYAEGVTVTGTSEPGATLVITMGDFSETITVGESGTWEITFDSAAAPEGEYESEISVYAVDGIGNSATYGDVLVVDTVVDVAFDDLPFGGDYTINGAEAEGTLAFSGTAQAGSTVVLTFNGNDYPAEMNADGSWGYNFAPGTFPGGEYTAEFTATATDGAGNVTSTTSSWAVDTVTNVTLTAGFAGPDGVINADDATNGYTLTGTTQPGNTVEVQIGTTVYAAQVTGTGSWTLNIPASDIEPGAYQSNITVTATDAAGNVATAGDVLNVDTLGFVAFSGAPVTIDDVVNAEEAGGAVSLTGTTHPGSDVTITMNGQSYAAVVDAAGSWTVTFPGGAFPGGEYDMPVTATATTAAGNSSSANTLVAVDTQGWVRISGEPVTADDVINADEASGGVTLSGLTEPGSAVTVQLGDATTNALVSADGVWTATFTSGQIPGGQYTAPVTVTAVDAAGNTSSASDTLAIDTETAVTVDLATVETDGVVNADEASDGVILTGTTEPGATVLVTFAGVTHPATVAANGTWTAEFLPTEVPRGETMASVEVVATDAAGNSATTGGQVEIDTVINVDIAGPIAGDDVINSTEQGQGLVVNGTVEPGSTVVVTLGDVSKAATVATDGSWSVGFMPYQIPEGDYASQINAVATDSAGNMASIAYDIEVDTFVEPLGFDAPVEGDNIVNAEEQSDGIVFAGTVEAGSSVTVTFNNTTHTASVDAFGNWSAGFTAAEVGTGEFTDTVTLNATDAAGNLREEEMELTVDTLNPDAPVILSFSAGGTGVRDVGTELTDDITQIQQIDGNGNVSDVAYDVEVDEQWGEMVFDFSQPIPTGSHLVVTAADEAGNHAGTLFVMEDPASDLVNLDNAGLEQFDIQAIDLQFASNGVVEITPDQLVGLSSFTNDLTIHGGDDDAVVAQNASATGETREIDGAQYDVYTLGEGTLIIDQDIQVNPTLV